MTEEPPLEIDDLTAGYGRYAVVEDIGLTLEPGDFMAIFGPNGGGKTTLIRTILGMTDVHKGSVRIFGEPPSRNLGRVGYVPQNGFFDRAFPITAGDIVLMGLRSRKGMRPIYSRGERDMAERAMRSVSAWEYRDMPLNDLSGGQLQRVLIARAMASDTDLLLLDEPTANLDPDMTDTIYEILRDINSEGVTIMMVTHDLMCAGKGINKAIHLNRRITSFDDMSLEGLHSRLHFGEVIR